VQNHTKYCKMNPNRRPTSFCETCKRDFRDPYSLLRHMQQSKLHQKLANADPTAQAAQQALQSKLHSATASTEEMNSTCPEPAVPQEECTTPLSQHGTVTCSPVHEPAQSDPVGEDEEDACSEGSFPLQVRSSYCSGPKAEVLIDDVVMEEPGTPGAYPTATPVSDSMFVSLWDRCESTRSPIASPCSSSSCGDSPANLDYPYSPEESERQGQVSRFLSRAVELSSLSDDTQLQQGKEVEDWLTSLVCTPHDTAATPVAS